MGKKHNHEVDRGAIVPKGDSNSLADVLANCGRLHSSGFLSLMDDFTLVIYSADADLWRFIEVEGAASLPATSLRFRLLPPMQVLHQQRIIDQRASASANPSPPSTLVASMLLGVQAAEMIVEKEGKEADPALFVAWPSQHDAELEVLIKVFQDLKVKVYHSGKPGAWRYFRSRYKSCLIVVHPDTRVWQIPGLFPLLEKGSTRVFSIGMQPAFTDRNLSFSCQRLFPNGKATFITDDLFQHHPEQASAVIRALLYGIDKKAKEPGAARDKVVTRPGIKEWLLKLAEESINEHGGIDTRRMRLYSDICALCPPEEEDPDDLPNPLPESNLVSPPPSELPGFSGVWEQDPARCTDMMVDWFAGWSMLNLRSFRKFVICYESAETEKRIDVYGQTRYDPLDDPKGWSKKYQHIGVVRPTSIASPK
jgi:hypothetical protein